MATDPGLAQADSDSEEVYAPVHAWRALGQLRATEAIRPLIDMIRAEHSDDWLETDMPAVFAQMGAEALPPLAELLADASASKDARSTAAASLARIALAYPGERARVVELLSRTLDAGGPGAELFNGTLVNLLLDLDATEAAPAMERAFAAGRVDLFAAGDWEDVQIELGLLTERITPPPPSPLIAEIAEVERRWIAAGVGRDLLDDFPRRSAPSGGGGSGSRTQHEREKARKKMAKKSRKQNRRK
jgi:hypothetical protein